MFSALMSVVFIGFLSAQEYKVSLQEAKFTFNVENMLFETYLIQCSTQYQTYLFK